MSNIVLRNKPSISQEEESIGVATHSVLENRYLSSKPKIIGMAMLSDALTYSAEIVAIWRLWQLTVGRQTKVLSLVSILWLFSIILDAIFHEYIFYYSDPKRHQLDEPSSKEQHPSFSFNKAWNGRFHAIGPFIRLSAPIGSLYIIIKYTQQLDIIVSQLNPPTALFELYYSAHQPFTVAPSLLWLDLLSMLPFTLVIACFFILCITYCLYLFARTCCLSCQYSHKSSKGQLSDEANVGADPDDPAHHLNDDLNESHRSLLLPFKNLFVMSQFAFASLSFSIFLVALRFTYPHDTVAFFHHLFWNLPLYFYIVTSLSAFSIFGIWIVNKLQWQKLTKLHVLFKTLSPPIHDYLLMLTLIAILVSSVFFFKNRESDPLWAIQLFFCVLIFERGMILVRSFVNGSRRLWHLKPQIYKK